ncbi:SLAM family member 9 [Xyrauchen texanus]|uniref:SLAM family member 9 n=1 Tax=Xyrauchen texanus TaxID=154827 RepID=UPI0022428612|nr:SLAM family member 9 [Xyrauchen texanus]
MELQIVHFIRTVLLIQICLLWSGQCLSLHFTNQQPIYVIKGHSLILQVQLDLQDGERVAKVTWDYKANNSAKILTVAEFPGRVSNGRVTVDQQGSTLKIRDYHPADSGIYTVTVTNQSGQRRSEQQVVQEYLAVNHVSVMVNVSHCTLHCMEAWGTEPTFTWLHEQAAVTEEVGRVSADGTSLYISSSCCGHFTCVVSNKLGHSSGTYTAEPCERKNKATTAVVVCSLLMLLLVTSLVFLLWRRHRYQSNRRERLIEPYEDTL